MEFLELLLAAKSGDKDSRDLLIEKNMGLVWSVDRRFSHRGYEAEDLFQIGVIGLMKAIDYFDTSYDVKFSTYAVPMISGEIKRFLRDDGAVKVSRSLKERAAVIRSCRSRLSTALGREPTIQEISRQTGISPEDIALAETATAATESIQRETGEEGFSLEDVLTDTESEDKMVDRLPQRERSVVELRYFHGLTQQRVARILDVSQVQVSRIEKKAMEILRELLR